MINILHAKMVELLIGKNLSWARKMLFPAKERLLFYGPVTGRALGSISDSRIRPPRLPLPPAPRGTIMRAARREIAFEPTSPPAPPYPAPLPSGASHVACA